MALTTGLWQSRLNQKAVRFAPKRVITLQLFGMFFVVVCLEPAGLCPAGLIGEFGLDFWEVLKVARAGIARQIGQAI
jgi:hypothetical protein